MAVGLELANLDRRDEDEAGSLSIVRLDVESRAESKGMRGGKGRRSLFRAGGGGFLDRFS